jgi:hypothetical protein
MGQAEAGHTVEWREPQAADVYVHEATGQGFFDR